MLNSRINCKLAQAAQQNKALYNQPQVRSLFGFSKKASVKSTTTNDKSSAAIKKTHYEPDFTVTPTTYAYQLPIPNENEDDIRISASPISLLFEYTGVQTSTSNYDKILQEFENYPTTTYKKLNTQYSTLLAKKKKIQSSANSSKLNFNIERPRNVKLTSKDFIDDSLYNPYYGYFNKDVEIYHINKPFNYKQMKSTDHFMEEWAKTYSQYNNRPRGMQLWHTPTELFQPYYGEAIARYLVANYKQKKAVGTGSLDKLVIYEMGAGNGTLMRNILNYIETNEPEIYAQTEYRIIEISSKLFAKQHKMRNSQLSQNEKENIKHAPKIKIVNKDIFQWNEVVNEEVYFLAFEVFDNFAHDVLKYNISTNVPYQGYVAIDRHNEFKEFFNPKLDFWCHKYFEVLQQTKYYQRLNQRSPIIKALNPCSPADELLELNELKNYLWPFRNKLSSSNEFIPTKLLEFFHILKKYFPKHNLVATDFNKLPNSVPNSYNGPVVQTLFQKTDPNAKDTVLAVPVMVKDDTTNTFKKSLSKTKSNVANEEPPLDAKEKKKREYKISKIPQDKMVNTTTYMVNQGYFDIMFPTNFELVSEMYSIVTGKPVAHQSHKNFLAGWSDVEKTTCQNGENPMLEFYTNVEFIYTTNEESKTQ